MNLCRIFLILVFLSVAVHAQTNGLLEDFNDNVLTGWQSPQATGTFVLTEQDSVLQIGYNRSSASEPWDNFNFTPASDVDVTANPYITVRVKSDVGTVLTFKPVYDGSEMDWLQHILPSDNAWHTYKFGLTKRNPYLIERIYMYLDGGSTEYRSGTVCFDDMRMGDSVRTADILDIAELEDLLTDARTLYDNAVEGGEEGQFDPGSRSCLLGEIQSAEQVLDLSELNNDMVDSTVWALADACVTFETMVNASDIGLIDPLATKETKYLYINLDDIAEDYLLFGMHDATGYGVGWTGDDDRSDVNDVCGSYPAVYSEDMNDVERNQGVARMKYRLTSAYDRGGVITICWHQYDPLGRGFYSDDTNNENIVATLLPGGEYHAYYKDKLRRVARFLKTLRGKNGESVPVIFRPYHEHTGGWFWWGDGQCSTQEYNAVWQFTVEYLRDSLNVHNLIYAISPSAQHIASQNDYFNIYPGDDYVDVFGLDHYYSSTILNAEKNEFVNDLRRIVLNAMARGKVAAATEVGQENVTTSNLWTEYILDPVVIDSLTKHITYAAVWRNQSTTHHFAPYPGHASVPDFLNFYNDSYTLFENNLMNMYALSSMDQIPPEFISWPDEPFTAYDITVTIQIKTSERAFLRYDLSDQAYGNMTFDFQEGQGTFDHITRFSGAQGESYRLYVHAADYSGNSTTESIEINFTIDTLQRPVTWQERIYSTEEWIHGNAPFHFDDGSSTGTALPYSRTTYFRKGFHVEEADSVYQMVAFVQYDNGFVLYLNGTAVYTINMPAGPVQFETWAGTGTQSSRSLTLDKSILVHLVDGENVLAVEMHQSENDTSDLKFDLQLIDPNIVIAYGSEWAAYAQGSAPPVKTVGSVGIENDREQKTPDQLYLYQNYPNPFNAHTVIRYWLPAISRVELNIYNTLGQKIHTIEPGLQQPGYYTVHWNADGYGSGIYYCHLTARSVNPKNNGRESTAVSRVRKLIYIK